LRSSRVLAAKNYDFLGSGSLNAWDKAGGWTGFVDMQRVHLSSCW
jgi:hypothetical protein